MFNSISLGKRTNPETFGYIFSKGKNPVKKRVVILGGKAFLKKKDFL